MPNYEGTLSNGDSIVAADVRVDYNPPAISVLKFPVEQAWGGTIRQAPIQIQSDTEYVLQLSNFTPCSIRTATRMADQSVDFVGIGEAPGPKKNEQTEN